MMAFSSRFRRDRDRISGGPRLDRRNAVKNIDYDADVASTSAAAAANGSPSLDYCPSRQTSFRIAGLVDGEVDLLCRSLGLSGPEDFSIPAAAWAARKSLSSPNPNPKPPQHPPRADVDRETGNKIRSPASIRGARPLPLSPSNLSPPPSMYRPEIDSVSSTWDLVRSFAPDEDRAGRRELESDEVEVDARLGLTADDLTESCSLSASNDDDDSSSTTTTEAMFVISPNGKFRRIIRSWMRGGLLGSGSFGTVYEGISDDGIFFAVKEVPLIDQGSNAEQCILQLEQEITLLSQFEHENIVQYYGTDKEEAKLFIFLELVTQGSLVSLYQKYHLQNSQVSAYTRQILNGLKYLHDRNVVHRDIKCANILVHVNGSVKLADFGLAKEITKFTILKSCKGSVYWMAPEVVNSKREYGPAVDIWSLGCTVLEMLTRQIPYPNMEWSQALFRIGQGEKPPIPDSLSRDARDFITQCLQANPEDRPSATQLLDHPFVRRSLPTSGAASRGIDR